MKQLTNLVASLLVSTLGIACGDNAEPQQPDPGSVSTVPAVPTVPTAATHAASCDDLGNGLPVADGEYTVYVGGDATKPWQVYCKGNNEYLTLPFTVAGANTSMYLAGGNGVGTTVVTTYTRVRIDPSTLLVDVDDQTFATSTGSITALGTTYDSMPYGVAMACGGAVIEGHSVIDLWTTPFAIASHYEVTGISANGGTLTSAGGHTMDIIADGDCGTAAPKAGASGWVLQLSYVGK